MGQHMETATSRAEQEKRRRDEGLGEQMRGIKRAT